MLDLPKHVPTVVSIDLTWKLAFQESRYHVSPLLKPVLELERRIFERGDLVISFSDWAATSVIDDYGIPASKVKVVRNGVTLPPPLTGLREGNGHSPNGHDGANGHSSGRSPNGRYLHPLSLGSNGHGANGMVPMHAQMGQTVILSAQAGRTATARTRATRTSS